MGKRTLFDGAGEARPLIDPVTGEVDRNVVVQEAGESSGVFDNAILLSLSFGRFGVSRGVSDALYEVEADKSLTKLTKEILESRELKAVEKFDGRMRKVVKARSLPSWFRSGVYLVPIRLVTMLDEMLRDRAGVRADLVQAFLGSYERCKESARDRLRDLFSEFDYPSAEVLGRRFYFEWRWVEATVPGRLSSVSRALYESAKETMAADMRSARDEGIMMLRAEFKKLVDFMVEKLQPSDDGKKKVFKATLVGNLDQFMGELFSARNEVLGDSALGALVQRGRELLQGVESKDLKNDALRESTRVAFEGIQRELGGLVVARPGRKLKLDDDDVAEFV